MQSLAVRLLLTTFSTLVELGTALTIEKDQRDLESVILSHSVLYFINMY